MTLRRQRDRFVFTIEENAIDSLSHAAHFFVNGRSKSELKLVVLLVFHSIELLLKARLSRFDHALIFTSPNRTKTIDFDQARGQLNKRHVRFTAEDRRNLISLHQLRNNLEHHELDRDVTSVQRCVRDALKFADSFSDRELNISLKKALGARKYNRLFKEIYNKHEKHIKTLIDRFARKELGRYQYWQCPNCDGELIVPEPLTNNCRAQCAECKRKYYLATCHNCGIPDVEPQPFGELNDVYYCGCPIDEEPVRFAW